MKNTKYLSLISLVMILTACDNNPYTSSPVQNQSTPQKAQEQSFDGQSLNDEQYLSCQVDTDCTKIQTKACQIIYASNFKYKQHAQDYFDRVEKAVGCDPLNKTLDNFDAACQSQQCIVIDKTDNSLAK